MARHRTQEEANQDSGSQVNVVAEAPPVEVSGVPLVPTSNGESLKRTIVDYLAGYQRVIGEIETGFATLPIAFKRLVLSGLKESIKRRRS